jgi:DNA-binding response OmpR family regulator
VSAPPNLLECPILVVDDVNMIRVMLTRLLKQLGFVNVFECTDGQQALELLRKQPIDLVLLDIQMPVLDGYATLEQMRQDETLRKVSVIMVTAVDAIESVARCIEAGAEDYMPKLFNPLLLDVRIKSCLQRRYLLKRVEELEAKTS